VSSAFFSIIGRNGIGAMIGIVGESLILRTLVLSFSSSSISRNPGYGGGVSDSTHSGEDELTIVSGVSLSRTGDGVRLSARSFSAK